MKAYLILSSRPEEEKAAQEHLKPLLDALPVGTELLRFPMKDSDGPETAANLLQDAAPDDLILCAPLSKNDDFGKRLAAKLGREICPDTEQLEEIDGSFYAVRSVYSTHRKALFPARGAVIVSGRCSSESPGLDPQDEESAAPPDPSAPWTVIASEPRTIPEDLSRAQIVFLGGRGLGSRKNFERMAKLAARFGASAACTRPVATNGWASPEKIVGTSGWSLNAKICIAFGVSGAGPLLRGLEGVGKLIAVNTDPEAPIFEYAAYGIREDCARMLDAWEALTEEE